MLRNQGCVEIISRSAACENSICPHDKAEKRKSSSSKKRGERGRKGGLLHLSLSLHLYSVRVFLHWRQPLFILVVQYTTVYRHWKEEGEDWFIVPMKILSNWVMLGLCLEETTEGGEPIWLFALFPSRRELGKIFHSHYPTIPTYIWYQLSSSCATQQMLDFWKWERFFSNPQSHKCPKPSWGV